MLCKRARLVQNKIVNLLGYYGTNCYRSRLMRLEFIRILDSYAKKGEYQAKPK
jgi:hypothetical protein